jgi:hypothetical protein
LAQQYCFKIFEPGGFFERADHVEPKRRPKPERTVQDAPVEPGDYQHRFDEILIGEEAQKLDTVHSRHSEIEGDHLRAGFKELVPELLILFGNYRLVSAEVRGLRDEFGKRRFVIDEEQLGDRHPLSSPASFTWLTLKITTPFAHYGQTFETGY